MKDNFFKFALLTLFLIFIALYYSSNSGLIDYQARNKTVLTEEKIKQFEEDVKNGKEIDINDYVSNINRNYQTKLSQAGLNVSNTISKVVKTGVDNIFRYIDKAVTQ